MSANNVVWIMKHITWDGLWHVFYSGCFDNTPDKPDVKDKYYKAFNIRYKALIYAHGVVDKINEESYEQGFAGVEYGVCIVPELEKWKDKSWNMHQSMAQDILPDQLEILEKEIKELKKKVDYLKCEDFGNCGVCAECDGFGFECDGYSNPIKFGDWERIERIEKLGGEIEQYGRKDGNPSLSVKPTDTVSKPPRLKIMDGIKILNPSEQDECSHESHFISTKTECEKCEKLVSEKVDVPDTSLPYSNLSEVKPAGDQSEISKLPSNLPDDYYSNPEYNEDNENQETINSSEQEKHPSCSECDLYGECDHQGAYKTEGKWCNEGSKPVNKDVPERCKECAALTDEGYCSSPTMCVKKYPFPTRRNDGCYQFTYCNECLAYPMGLGCPNLTKGPVQLKDEVKHYRDGETWGKE